MKPSRFGLVAAVVALLSVAFARADVKVTVDHNDLDHSTLEFKFKQVPSPAKTNAAVGAKFTIVDGEKDENGAELDVLHDGKLPGDTDEPASNFFFNAGTDGGRILIDLGSATDVKNVNSYSWHKDTRAPQVYSLYGADGSEAGFKSDPKSNTDPTTVGWKLIAKVDTRPKTGDEGGQYGVNITDSSGSLGKFRYLLLAASRTESDDDFGNTFYSEITVNDGAEMIKPAEKAADKPGVKTVSIEDGKFTATIDTTDTPDLTDWADKELAPVVVEWYPQLVKMLPSQGFDAPTHFSITFHDKMDGVAYTMGNRINCAAKWYRTELTNEAKGSIVHEMTHVVQQYGFARTVNRHPNRNPGWLVEGLCDYIRWYHYEPTSKGAAISKRGYPSAKYDGSYRITANFLNYVVDKYDKDLIVQLNQAMREGNYSEDLWKQHTGKSAQDLNDEWKAQLAKTLGIPATQPA